MKNQYKQALLFLLLVPCWVIAAKYDIDLVVLHYAATLIHHGDYSRVFAQNYANGLELGRYFYGPISLVIFHPLGMVPYVVAKWAWIAIQTICFVLFWRFLNRLYPFLLEDKTRFAWILVFIVAINPIHNNFQSNNIQLMLAALLLGSELLVRSKSRVKNLLGGMLCVVGGMVKVFPLFIAAFYFFSRGKYTRAGLILGFLLCALAPFAYFGTGPGMLLTQDFLRNLTTYSAQNSLTKVEDILCLPSLLTRWFALPDGSFVVKAVILGVSAAFFLYCWKKRDEVARDDRFSLHLFALASALMVLLNPSTRPHYFIFYVPAFCSLLEIMQEQSAKIYLGFLVTVATLLIAFTAEGVVGKDLNNRLEAWSVPTVGMVLLCLTLVVVVAYRATFGSRLGRPTPPRSA